MALQRYVNLNKVAVSIQNPKGQSIMVSPFRESLDDRSRRTDAIYVVEGEFWQRYMNGTPTSALQRFPLPAAFGRESFPPLPVHHLDGREVDGQMLTSGAERAQVAAVASLGRYRAAGDVLTPAGKIRRTNPLTGLDEEIEDTPANRNVLPPLNAPGPSPDQLRVSVIDYMTEKNITTAEQLDALSDEALLKIPGLHPHAVPRLRENLRQFLQQQSQAKVPATPVTKTTVTKTTVTKTTPVPTPKAPKAVKPKAPSKKTAPKNPR